MRTRGRYMSSRGRRFGRVGAGFAAWNLASLPGLDAGLLVAQMRSLGLLWQDLSKTTHATDDGHPVRVAVCPFTGTEATAPSDSARPVLWDELGDGRYWSLAFDGSDDRLDRTRGNVTQYSVSTGLIHTSFADAWWFGFGSAGNMFALSGMSGTATRFILWGDDITATVSDQTGLHSVYTAVFDGSLSQRLYLNGSQVDARTAGSHTFTAAWRIGQRTDGGGYFAGRIAALVSSATAPVDADRGHIESLIATLQP